MVKQQPDLTHIFFPIWTRLGLLEGWGGTGRNNLFLPALIRVVI